MQNESLHRTQEELVSSQLRYFNLYDLSPVGYFTLTREGLILETNITAGSLLGVARNTLVKKSLTRFILCEDQDIYYHHRKQLFETGTPQMCDLRLLKKDGSLFWARLESTIAHEDESEDTLCYTLTSDITELKQAEERIKHLNLVLRAIRNISKLIFKENDRERLIKSACNSLTEKRGYYSSFIVLLDEKGKIDTYAEAGLGKDFLPMLKRLKKGELTAFGQIALKQEEVVIIKDPASACPDCPLVQVCSDRGSVMTVRLGRDEKIYGVMSVSIPAHFITDKEEQALFMEAAGDIALGLNSIEMRKKLDTQTHDLQQSYQRTKKAMDATIETMSKIVE
ncbi:MAG: PAS domain S-box protein, partial [Atribacterota bacterium]|nr:PAS domain S-box protein [Atribacterota bacterium]